MLFRTMPDNKKVLKRTPTVEETNAALKVEFAKPDSKAKDPLPESGSKAPEAKYLSNQIYPRLKKQEK